MIDRLMEKIERTAAPIVIGLDPAPGVVPETLFDESAKRLGKTIEAGAAALLKFNREIIDAIRDIVPAVKPNIAFYERYGLEGIRAYLKTIEYAAACGMMVIGDVKRGDIGSTAAAYSGHIEPASLYDRTFAVWNEDAVTLNPYLGADSIEPFLDAARQRDKGLFILVKTSNKGSADIQDLPVAASAGAGESCSVYEYVAGLVSEWGKGEGLMGASGYSKVGAVVGATHPEVGAKLRHIMPRTFFLVPGYGAQGAGAKDVKHFFDSRGKGAIVNSSRGVIGAWKEAGKGAGYIAESARAAALRMKEELGSVLQV